MTEEQEKRGTVLIVDDDKELVRLLQFHVKRIGFTVESAHNGMDGLNAALSGRFEFIILDLMLPALNGLDVLKRLRDEGIRTPVLILSARTELQQRVTALKLGADDFLLKPFEYQELLARIEAIIRRVQPASVATKLSVGDLECDVLQRKVVRAGKEILLSALEFKLLEYFLRNKNKILNRSEIAEHVWGYTFDTGTNIVEVYISYLRNALNDGFTTKLIKTIRGEGYMLEE